MPAPASAARMAPASSARPNTGPALLNGWVVVESAAAEKDSATANAPASAQRVDGQRASMVASEMCARAEAAPDETPPNEASAYSRGTTARRRYTALRSRPEHTRSWP